MDIFPDEVRKAADEIGGDWIKGGEFEGAGLVLQVVKPMEKIVASNPKYGAEEDNFLVKQEILEVGQTFRFTFKTPEGKERKIDSSSSPFFIGIKQCEELGVGDWVKIVRTGKTDKTRYTVEKVEAPEVAPKTDYPEEEIDTSSVPF